MLIEDALRKAATRGSVSMTLVVVSNGTYQATLSVNGERYHIKLNSDPAAALSGALNEAVSETGSHDLDDLLA